MFVGPNIVTNGLVLAVDAGSKKSYSGSGTTWSDLSGNGNDGTLVNGPTFNSNGYLDFDGTNDVVTTTYTSITGTNPRSISVWFNPDVTQNREIMGYGTQSAKQMWDILLYNGKVGVHLYSSTAEAGISYIVGEWQCVTFTYTHPAIKSYMNGVYNTLYSNTDINTGEAHNLKIGDGAYGGGYNYFNGKIGPIHIYDRELSAEEILQNYNSTKSRFGL